MPPSGKKFCAQSKYFTTCNCVFNFNFSDPVVSEIIGGSIMASNRILTSLGNSGLYWTVFAWNRDTAVPAEGNGDLQTLICVLVLRLRWFPTLSNPVLWQNWMAAYSSCTLQMKTLFPGWPIMVHEIHTRRSRRLLCWHVILI